MTKEQKRLGITGLIAFGFIVAACNFVPAPDKYPSQVMKEQAQQEMQATYMLNLTETQVAAATPLQMSHYLRKMKASVRTVNGMPTPAPQKPFFRGWAQEKFYSENKKVLAQYRAGNLDQLINVLNNQREQQVASR
jgi:hypothetical protein